MRVAIVNDLSLAREVLRRVVVSAPGHSIAWMAEDGDEAVKMAAANRPDVILMDLVMPRLNGVEATRQIMKQSPCPILVVTSTVSGHYELVIQAMGVGALDAVETPTLGAGGTILKGEKLLARLAKLESAVAGHLGSALHVPLTPAAPVPNLPPLVLIGSSTGGPEALATVLSGLPVSLPAAVLVSQHIGAQFVPGLVQQLAHRSRLPIRMAKEGDLPQPGTVLVAATDDHMEVSLDQKLRYTCNPRNNPYRPSADVLFASAGGCWPHVGVAVLLTGMGTDGAEGLLRLRMLGWHTIAQNEATCVVYGMPKAAIEKNAAREILPLPEIAAAITSKIFTMGKT